MHRAVCKRLACNAWNVFASPFSLQNCKMTLITLKIEELGTVNGMMDTEILMQEFSRESLLSSFDFK